MASLPTPERGTLIISALLILALFFAGYWISDYAGSPGAPWDLLPWFGAAAAIIIVLGLGWVIFGGRGSG